MKISRIEVIGLEYVLPSERSYGSAAGIHSKRQVTLVKVTTEDGIEGFGEARAPLALVRTNVDLFKTDFIDSDIFDREITFQRFLNRSYHLGLQGPHIIAYSGLNIAMLDALGKGLNLPVCKLIGGAARNEVGAYATGGYFAIGADAGFDRQLEALAKAEMAITKIKVGRGPAYDGRRAKRARQVLGDKIQIAVDANANYTVPEALDSMRQVASHNIAWYEEPLAPNDYAGYAHLRRVAPMSVSAGESHYMAFDFQRLLDGGCIDIAQPAVCGCGGLDEARKIADLCRLHSTRIVASAWASGVGVAAAVQFAASLPSHFTTEWASTPQLVEYDVGENPLRDGILAEPLVIKNGKFVVPTAPGLGIVLNNDVIARHQIT
jgi:D-galactarolactone cycloisomerase